MACLILGKVKVTEQVLPKAAEVILLHVEPLQQDVTFQLLHLLSRQTLLPLMSSALQLLSAKTCYSLFYALHVPAGSSIHTGLMASHFCSPATLELLNKRVSCLSLN